VVALVLLMENASVQTIW